MFISVILLTIIGFLYENIGLPFISGFISLFYLVPYSLTALIMSIIKIIKTKHKKRKGWIIYLILSQIPILIVLFVMITIARALSGFMFF